VIRKAPANAKSVEGDYLVMPRHIDTKQPFWDAFGKMEVEGTANFIVRKAQKAKTWAPFALREPTALEDHGWIAKGADGLFRVTDAFVRRCFDASPAS